MNKYIYKEIKKRYSGIILDFTNGQKNLENKGEAGRFQILPMFNVQKNVENEWKVEDFKFYKMFKII